MQLKYEIIWMKIAQISRLWNIYIFNLSVYLNY